MEYNSSWKLILDIISLVLISFYIINAIKLKSIKPLVFCLPILFCFDIGINQSIHGESGLKIKLWHLIILIVPLLKFNFLVRFTIKNISIIIIIILFSILQYMFFYEFVVIVSLVKIFVIYIPLLISINIYNEVLTKEEKFDSLMLSLCVIFFLSLVQFSSYHFFHVDLFIINGFNKPSAGFSEPVWTGIFIVMLLFKVKDFEIKTKYNIMFISVLYFFGSKSSILFSQLALLKTKVVLVMELIVLLVFIYLLIYYFKLYEASNVIDSFYIHTGNWKAAILVLQEISWPNIAFGLGLGGGNYYLNSQIDYLEILQLSFLSTIQGDVDFSRLLFGADFANLFLDSVLSFGIVGVVLLVLSSIRLTTSLFKNQRNLFVFFLLTSMVHPIYFMPYAIFILLISLDERGQ